ncbi:uncharacterized protein LOC122013922 [Zingiber officinale]|uniref:uncharacterized protein LOC122013922 n=1 Tax=Zingiber officinale TaxID=94328 RepID=UPI001C4B01E6|nr:uncharacterized protein LOC122013922 [Zingiber officinale]
MFTTSHAHMCNWRWASDLIFAREHVKEEEGVEVEVEVEVEVVVEVEEGEIEAIEMTIDISKPTMVISRAKTEDEINILTNQRLPEDKEKEAQSNFAEKQEVETLLMAIQANQEPESDVWYVDMSCSNHMCGISFDDSSTVKVMGKGNIKISTKNDSVEIISNVLYVPDLKSNLLSDGQFKKRVM